jgi:hypothetical protein
MVFHIEGERKGDAYEYVQKVRAQTTGTRGIMLYKTKSKYREKLTLGT